MDHYQDYKWEKGFPYGIKKVSEPVQGETYRILADPYRKWISIEKYMNGEFESVVYDSNLFDFRNLSEVNQTAWQKIPLDDTTALIRNQDDRAIVYEHYLFEGDKCRECHVKSIHGVPLSTQKMYFKELGDDFNGVKLYDTNEHLVLVKKNLE